MKEKVKIVEVGPRDGLQNEPVTLEVSERVEFIRKLIDAGLRHIEAGSFVSPKAIPQLVDSERVWDALRSESCDLFFLVPNERGFERAQASGVKSIAVFTATSEAFNRKNIGMSVEESLSVIKKVVERAKASLPDCQIRGYISTAFGCPYEGDQSPSIVVQLAKELLSAGCEEISVGDTIGVAHPSQVKELIQLLKGACGLERLSMHFHDTRGMALVNIEEALRGGIRIFDASVGGLGGCPYASGSSGNVATEEVVWLLEGHGFETGISLEKIFSTSKWIERRIGRQLKSKLYLSEPKKLYYGKRLELKDVP